MVCHDLATENQKFDHMGLLSQDVFINFVYQAATSDDWLIGGTNTLTGITPIDWKSLKS